MNKISRMNKPELQELPQIEDRLSFLYLEHCKINRQDNAITATDEEGETLIPAGTLSVLLLGPGTSVTHRAMELIGDSGVSVVWVGEQGVRYYANGRSLTHSSRMLIRQAECVSNQRKHLDVVRKMYAMRFPGEDVSKLTLQQLRGREGARIRKTYRKLSEKWNVPWNGRVYKPNDFAVSDPVNQALSIGNACLYGIAHSVICAIGCSAGLGFVHVGHELSFVYDVADLYKAEISIPIAFESVSESPNDLESFVRKRHRNKFVEMHLLERMVRDIKYLFSEENDNRSDQKDLALWDGNRGTVENGKSY